MAVFMRAHFMHRGLIPLFTQKNSFIWLGLKKIIPIISPNLTWVLEEGSQISFWSNNQLGRLLVSHLEIPNAPAHTINAHICNLLPNVVASIDVTHLPLQASTDSLCQSSSLSCLLSIKEAYSHLLSFDNQVLLFGRCCKDAFSQIQFFNA